MGGGSLGKATHIYKCYKWPWSTDLSWCRCKSWVCCRRAAPVHTSCWSRATWPSGASLAGASSPLWHDHSTNRCNCRVHTEYCCNV